MPKICIILVMFIIFAFSAEGKFQWNMSRVTSAVSNNKLNIGSKLRNSMNKVKQVIPRIPNACFETVAVTTKSFTANSALFVPAMLLMDIKNIKNVKPWLVAGCEKGMSFAKVSAIYAGGEALSRKIRNKEDRFNSYFGSGLSSAVMKIQEGPLAMGQGFAAGFAFLYTFDKVFGQSAFIKKEYTAVESLLPELVAAPAILSSSENK